MVTYETIFIADSQLPENKLGDINNKISDIVKKFNGKVNQLDDWGTRRLGYKVGKHGTGHYIYVNYSAEPGVVAEIERTLQIREDVIKQMTIKLDTK